MHGKEGMWSYPRKAHLHIARVVVGGANAQVHAPEGVPEGVAHPALLTQDEDHGHAVQVTVAQTGRGALPALLLRQHLL